MRSCLIGVAADELFTDGDLDGVADDGDLDLAAPELVADPVAGAGEADVAGRVDLAGHRRRRRRRPRLAGSAGGRLWRIAGGLLGDGVPAGVGRDQHTAVMDLHQPAVADDLDGLDRPATRPTL